MVEKMSRTNPYWWDLLEARPVWFEITRRPNDEIGKDLNHFNKRTFPLLIAAKQNDLVLHWDSKRGCIVGCSKIADTKVDVQNSSYFRMVKNFVQFPENAITLASLRLNHAKIESSYNKLAKQLPDVKPLLFPFAKYAKQWQKLQPQLNYLTAAPPDLVEVLGGIYESHRDGSALYKPWSELGFGRINDRIKTPVDKYLPVDELIKINSKGEPRLLNAKELEKSVRAHSKLQNQVAVWLADQGLHPTGRKSLDPLPVDIQWIEENIHVVGEVKSIKSENETAQMRRGIGQVLHYKKLFEERVVSGRETVQAALIVSHKPNDIWIRLCKDLEILLAWPGKFKQLLVSKR